MLVFVLVDVDLLLLFLLFLLEVLVFARNVLLNVQ